MIYDYNDYKSLNKKLYDSGIHVDCITSDPNVIVEQYREAGVDVSMYDPMDLVNAFEYYIDYSFERDHENDNASFDNDDDDEVNSDDDDFYEDTTSLSNGDECDEEIDHELWKPLDCGRYYKTDFTEDQKTYLKALYEDSWILYKYLEEKGVYKEYTLVDDSNKESDEIIIIAKKVNSQDYFFTNQKLISKKEGTKHEYNYAMWCYLERRFNRDLPHFDRKEWYTYLKNALLNDETLKDFFKELFDWSLRILAAAPNKVPLFVFKAIYNEGNFYMNQYFSHKIIPKTPYLL